MNRSEKLMAMLDETSSSDLLDRKNTVTLYLRGRKDTGTPDSLGDKLSRMSIALSYAIREGKANWDSKSISTKELAKIADGLIKLAKKDG